MLDLAVVNIIVTTYKEIEVTVCTRQAEILLRRTLRPDNTAALTKCEA